VKKLPSFLFAVLPAVLSVLVAYWVASITVTYVFHTSSFWAWLGVSFSVFVVFDLVLGNIFNKLKKQRIQKSRSK
jgi:uncharacterized membrane protein SirB2